MKRTLFVAGLVAFGVTAAIAQSNKVEQRQALMKEMGAQSRTLGGMLRGQAPFDAAQVQAGLKVFAENAQKAGPLFTEDTKGAEKTAALPALWEIEGPVRFDPGEVRPGRPGRHGVDQGRGDHEGGDAEGSPELRHLPPDFPQELRDPYLRGRPDGPPVSFGEQWMRKALIGLVALAILGVLGFLALTSPSAYRLIASGACRRCRPRSGCARTAASCSSPAAAPPAMRFPIRRTSCGSAAAMR